MSSDTALIARYIQYRSERAKIKERQRQELEEELSYTAGLLGQEIVKLRETGSTIQDIGFAIGLKNRTFIYKMIDTYEKSVKGDEPETEPETEPEEIVVKTHEIEYAGDTAVVTVYNEEDATVTNVSTFQGIIDFPEEWVTEPDRAKRKLYTQIVKEITQNVLGN